MIHILSRYPLVCLLFMLVLSACTKDDGPDDQKIASRTVLVYIAANNNLATDAYTNLNQMERGFKDIDGHLIAYAKIYGQSPKLYEIGYDESEEIRSRVIKTYGDHDSTDPEVMKAVFSDAQQLYPATSYGAVLWSHASNWYPSSGVIRTRSFGEDGTNDMDIKSLSQAMPDNLDFLIFDACSMASVEVLYQLREVAPYILASPTEVLSVGMPYDLVEHHFFNPDIREGLVKVADDYVDYYQNKNGLERSASFSLIDTRKLSLLAQEVKDILSSDRPSIDRSTVQRMDFDLNTPVEAYDFLDFAKQYFPAQRYADLEEVVGEVVLHKVYTSHFLGMPIDHFCGVSTYVPEEEDPLKIITCHWTGLLLQDMIACFLKTVDSRLHGYEFD